MQTHALQFGRHKPQAHSHAVRAGGSFTLAHAKTSGSEKHDALVKQTQKWVAQTFYGEMLKQMRNSPFKSKMLDGGAGGQAFTQMFDQQLADKMASGSGRKLVDSIVEKIEGDKAAKAAATQPVLPPPATPAWVAPATSDAGHLRKWIGPTKSKSNFAHIKAARLSPTLQAQVGGVR